MWLIKQKLNGIDPPASLTPEMIPPSVRKAGETIVVIKNILFRCTTCALKHKFIVLLSFLVYKSKQIIYMFTNLLMYRISRSSLECSPKHYQNYANYKDGTNQDNVVIHFEFYLSDYIQLYYSSNFVILPTTGNEKKDFF